MEQQVCDLVDLSKYVRFNDGYRYIWTATDHFFGFKWAASMKGNHEQEVVQIVTRIWSEFGVPHILHCNNGGKFIAESLAQVNQQLPSGNQ